MSIRNNQQIPQDILVHAPNWIGDQILAYPFFYYLRRFYPHAQIAVASVPWVESIQFQHLINQTFSIQRSFKSQWSRSPCKRNKSWDMTICLPQSFSSAWRMYRAGAQVRRGYQTDGRSFLLTEKLPRHSQSHLLSFHRSEVYLFLLSLDVQQWQNFFPHSNSISLQIQNTLREFLPEKAWPNAEPIEPPSTPYWVLAPGSTASSRRWPTDSYIQFTRCVQKTTGWPGLVIGGRAENEIAKQLCSEEPKTLSNWIERGKNITAYWKILKNAQFVICNESGLAHLASLCGSFIHIVCGAANPRHTHPLGPGKIQISTNPIACWPCERNHCHQKRENYLQCLQGIQAETVWKEIQSGLC